MRTQRIAAAMLLALAGCSPTGKTDAPSQSFANADLPPAPFTVKAQYHTHFQGPSNQIGPWIDLVNTGASAVPLSRVTVRYWFTSDGTQTLQYFCDYTARGCRNVTSKFVRLAAPVAQADTYLELGFTEGAGTLNAGQGTGELYQRIAKADWSLFDQAGDHSYDGSHWALADNARITVAVDGQVVWGAPPSGTEIVDPGRTDVSDEEYAAFVRANNELGFDLLKKLTAEGEANLVYSPTSISHALGMAYVGARGTTGAEMAQVLHSQLSPGQAATAFGKLGSELTTRDVAAHSTPWGTKELRLRLADALWVQDGFEMQPTYLDALQTRFGAPARLLDFDTAPEASRATINDWVAQITADRIKDLLGPGSITPDTRLVLTNAVYFKGSWETSFLPQSTRTVAFHPLSGPDTTASMMSTGLKQRLVYAHGDGWQLVEIPYVGGELQMTIVLPDAGRFSEVRDALSSAWLDQAAATAAIADVSLHIPKFRIEPPSISLGELLQSLGMREAFDLGRADFTGITPAQPLAISDVVHKAYIAVDEAGTEAAAATGVIFPGAAPGEPVDFTANRPFVYLIRDASGAILFAGQVIQP